MSPGHPPRSGTIPRAARDLWLWALVGLLGLLLALYLAFPRLDADQAITGLVGVYVLRGEFPTFFWMQDHAGVPESYMAAPLFYTFGISRRVLDLVPALSTLALSLAVYRTGVLLFGRGPGLLGVLFTTVVSAYVAANYTLARAYYIEHLLVGQIVLLGAALWLARPMSEPARCRVAIAMGLAGGVGLYFNFQIIDALVPAVLVLLVVEPALPFRRTAWLGVGAFFLGSLPFWTYNLMHGWATFATGARFQGRFSGPESARILFVDLIPVVLGVRAGTDQPAHLPGPLAWTIPLIVGGAVLLLLTRVIAGIGRLRRDVPRAGEAMLLVGLAVTLGVVWYGGYIRVPRYLLPLVPLLALVLGRTAQLTWRWTRIGTVAWVAVYLFAVGLDLAPDITAFHPAARARYGWERALDARLFEYLRARDFRKAYAFDYWLAPAAHLRGPGHHRRSAVQRPVSAVHARCRPLLPSGVRGPGWSRDVPRLDAGTRRHRPGGRRRRLSRLPRLHGAARGASAGPRAVHRQREPRARRPRERCSTATSTPGGRISGAARAGRGWRSTSGRSAW